MPFQGLMRNLTSHTKPRKSNVWQGSPNATYDAHAQSSTPTIVEPKRRQRHRDASEDHLDGFSKGQQPGDQPSIGGFWQNGRYLETTLARFVRSLAKNAIHRKRCCLSTGYCRVSQRCSTKRLSWEIRSRADCGPDRDRL